MRLVQPPLLKNSQYDSQTTQQVFENTEYVNTKGAAKYLTRLLGKFFTPNAIRLRVHRKQLVPIKPFGELGESYFSISELRQRFTSPQRRGR
jgi:hypothetical protein